MNKRDFESKVLFSLYEKINNGRVTVYCNVIVNAKVFKQGKVDICEYNAAGFMSKNTEFIPLLPDVTVVDSLLLPGIKAACEDKISVFNRFPSSLSAALSTGGFTGSSSTSFLNVRTLSAALLNMRDIIREDINLVGFHNFFLKTLAFGYKESISLNNENELDLPLAHILDYTKIDTSLSLLDIGINACWVRNDKQPTVTFLKEAHKGRLIGHLVEQGNVRSKFYSSGNAAFGNCGYKVSNNVNAYDPVKFITYSDLKYHFVGPLKGRKSGMGYFTDMFNPMDLYKTSESVVKLFEFYKQRMEENRYTPFTFRFEGRIPLDHLTKDLVNTWSINVA
ncbi:unnamed protein product [Mucor hiemalis]